MQKITILVVSLESGHFVAKKAHYFQCKKRRLTAIIFAQKRLSSVWEMPDGQDKPKSLAKGRRPNMNKKELRFIDSNLDS